MTPWQIVSWHLTAGTLASVALQVAGAQPAKVADSVSTCDYRVCALTIAPTWNGLAVRRGTSGPRIANLNFFVPHDISSALGAGDRGADGVDSLSAAVRRAVQLRRAGASFTDIGALTLIVAGVRASTASSNKRLTASLAGAGAALLGIGVPFQFAADGALSRAVWWYNLRYARTTQSAPQ